MGKLTEIKPVYFEGYKPKLEEGILYISREFGACSHLCACGCGVECFLSIEGEGIKCNPIHHPWHFIDNNGKITITPSIGNWRGENPYHAHYFITENKIVWC